MRRFVLSVLVCFGLAVAADGADYVRGYVRSNGTYVAPHYRSHADGSFYNNWSTAPNVNPYTGSHGYRHYPTYPTYSHSPYRFGR